MNSGSSTPLAGGKQVARTARVPVSGRGGLVTGVALWTAPAERTGADHRPAMALSNYQRRSAINARLKSGVALRLCASR